MADTTPSIFRRLLGLMRPFAARAALGLLLSVLTISASIGLMMSSAWLISTAALQLGVVSLGVAPTAVRFFGISRALFRYLERLTNHDVTFRMLARLRVWFYERIEPLSPAQMASFSSGDLMARVVSDIDELQNLYLRVFLPPLVAVVIITLMGITFALFSPAAALVLVAFMLFAAILLPLLTGWVGRTAGAGVIEARALINIHTVDTVQGLADAVAYGYSRARADLLARFNADLSERERQMARLDGVQEGLSVLLMQAASATVLAVALGRVDGVLLATLALGTVAAFEAVSPLALAAQNFGRESAAARRVFEIIEQTPVIEPPDHPQPLPPADRTIRLAGVSFRYGLDEPFVFRDFSLSVPHGGKLAVMGPSGSGKSSLVNMLLRFWEYEAGSISVGGVDLRSLDTLTIRETFGVMTQRTHLFNTTIAENIRIARSEATDDAVIEAARAAHVHDFITALPQGYETLVGENGMALSGGERQRIAMARVILKDSPVWLLDEFTANLDPVTANRLLESVLEVAKPRTVMLITHRAALVEQGAFGEVVRLLHAN